MSIDFQALRAANPIVEVVGRYLDVVRRGTEYKALCPFHADRTPSLCIVPSKDKAFCQPCGWHGDVLDFVADIDRLTTADGKRDINAAAARLGHLPTERPAPAPIQPDDSDQWRPIMPAPDDAPEYDPGRTWNPRSVDRRTGKPGKYVDWNRSRTRLDAYRDAAGRILGYVVRLEFDGQKMPMAVTYCEHDETHDRRWCAVKFPDPRPLMGLDELAARPTAPVLVVSGEKCRESARANLPGFVVVTWSGGDQNWHKTDWAQLHTRKVTFWPDLDLRRVSDEPGAALIPYQEQSGYSAMAAVAALLAAHGSACRMLDLRAEFASGELPGGWDVADAIADGWDRGRLVAFCRDRVVNWNPTTQASDTNKVERPRELQSGAETSGEAGAESHPGGGPESVIAHREERAAPANEDDTENDDAPPSRDHSRHGRDAMSDNPDPGRIWPDPINLLGQFEPPVIRPEWLPAPLVDFVFDQADLLGCDPSIVALSCIVSCAAALHDGIEIQPKRYDPTWTEQARLWGAIVGDPSTRKTPAMKKATGHLRKLDMKLAEQSAGKVAEYERQAKVDKKLEAAWIKAQSQGKSAGSAPEATERPPVERLIAEDITVEALSNVLKDNARGVLVMTDELSGWFGSMDAYKSAGGKDRGLWLEVYNGGPKRVDRVMRGSILVPNWSASILGGIQPEAIRKVAGQLYDDGLLQRFMPVCGKSVINGVKDRAPNMEAVNAYRNLLDDIFGAKPCGDVVTLSPRAHEYRESLSDFSHRLATAELLTPSFRSHLGKWDGLFARLLLTFHAIDQRSKREHPCQHPVSEATAKRTHDFMRHFLFPHAASFYMGILGRSERDTAAEWIATWLLADHLEAMSLRELMQSYKRWRTIPDWQQKQVLRALEDSGWIAPTGEGSDRRPNRWAVNPKVHELFGRFAQDAKFRREESREAVRQAFAKP